MSLCEEVGRNVVFIRNKIGVTQEWLALESEVALSYLRSIEHGEANPSVNLVSRLAHALQIPVNILFAKDLELRYEKLMVERSTEEVKFTEPEVLFLHHILSTALCEDCRDRVEEERQRFKSAHSKDDVILFSNYIGR